MRKLAAVLAILMAPPAAAAAYIEMPAEVPQDLADKIEVIIADGDWSEHATVLLCDARRLAA